MALPVLNTGLDCPARICCHHWLITLSQISNLEKD